MDENTIFSKQNNQGSQPPSNNNNPDSEKTRITNEDLYGPSNLQPPIEPQSPKLSIDAQTSINPSTQSEMPANDQQSTQAQYYPEPAQIQQDSGEEQGFAQDENAQYQAQAANRFVTFLGNKKLIIAGLISFVLFLVILGLITKLIGSGSGGGGGNVSLTYWGLWEEEKVMQVVISDFEKKNPGIKIKYEKQDPDKYKERLITRIKNDNEAPDLFTFHNSWVSTLTSTADNILLPLSKDTISPEQFKNVYFPVIQKDLIRNGAIYGIPQGIDTLALFINRDIFDAAGIEVPTTWEEFNSSAKKLTVKDDKGMIKTAGVALGTYDNINHGPDIAALLMATNGVDLTALEKNKSFVAGALVYYTSFANDTDGVWDNTLNNSRDMFASGNLGMFFGFSWDTFIINEKNKNLKYEVHPVPFLPRGQGEPVKVTIASYWANGVSVKSKNQKEALLFLKYLAEKETYQRIYTEASKTRAFGAPYPRVDMANSLSGNKSVSPFVEQAKYATSSYFASDTKDELYNGPLNDYLGNAIRQVASGGVVAETAVETMLSGINQVQSNSR